jgi:hypothetical protein
MPAQALVPTLRQACETCQRPFATRRDGTVRRHAPCSARVVPLRALRLVNGLEPAERECPTCGKPVEVLGDGRLRRHAPCGRDLGVLKRVELPDDGDDDDPEPDTDDVQRVAAVYASLGGALPAPAPEPQPERRPGLADPPAPRELAWRLRPVLAAHLWPILARFGDPGELCVDVPLDLVERAHIIRTLDRYRGNKRRAAAVLGIDTKTLYNKLRRYGIELSAWSAKPAEPAAGPPTLGLDFDGLADACVGALLPALWQEAGRAETR